MKQILPALLLLAFATASYATGNGDAYNRIDLAVSAGESVDNDTLVGLLYAQQEGSDTARLTREVNSRIAEAVALAKAEPAIRVQTMEYSTNPIYKNRTLSGWRVRQSIRLESRDAAVLSQMIGRLQQRLNVSSIRYALSPERRAQVEDGLISRAIAAFKARSALVAREMGAQDYRLVRMNISNASAEPRPYQMRTMAMKAEADAVPPTLEAGTRRVEVRISGTIELEP
ncbi:MAG TPA: DUF541 domain-containing protein [Sedimenticola thiotaurini]|uniref:DUF541 domain-containing protein n=1 Tax=Sedimenticola thiotaurini TaxID=1543721 RepID=A0A831W807_9GAMM|nr:DUF541 domain-containing protein [Sedimenticola thiotaurini]